MKGIILAGGAGMRLLPLTAAISKHLLPVYDKPMIYYPLSVLMLGGLRDILIITTPADRILFERLLGDGSQLGMRFVYAEQPYPEGIAQAFLIGRDFIGSEPCTLILGDNIFHGHRLRETVRQAIERNGGATVFSYQVRDPERYGVIAFDARGQPIAIDEKPQVPKSNHVVTGLYIYDSHVVDIASTLEPSGRRELEITDVNNRYLQMGGLRAEPLGRGFAWLDTGTHDGLVAASEYVRAVEMRQGLRIACIEEIAFRMGWIDEQQLRNLAEPLAKVDYGRYLFDLSESRG